MAKDKQLDVFLSPAYATQWLEKMPAVDAKIAHRLPPQLTGSVFFMSRIKDREVVENIKSKLVDAMGKGLSFDEFRAQLPDVIASQGGYIETVFRNATMTAYNAGRYSRQRSLKNLFPFLRYDAMNDSRTRPTHAALDGVIAPVDDPVWGKIYPPNGHNCRCTVIGVDEETANELLETGEAKLPPANPKVDAGWDYHSGQVEDINNRLELLMQDKGIPYTIRDTERLKQRAIDEIGEIPETTDMLELNRYLDNVADYLDGKVFKGPSEETRKKLVQAGIYGKDSDLDAAIDRLPTKMIDKAVQMWEIKDGRKYTIRKQGRGYFNGRKAVINIGEYTRKVTGWHEMMHFIQYHTGVDAILYPEYVSFTWNMRRKELPYTTDEYARIERARQVISDRFKYLYAFKEYGNRPKELFTMFGQVLAYPKDHAVEDKAAYASTQDLFYAYVGLLLEENE